VLDNTPIARAIGSARNQRVALSRFLDDGRLPAHNNWSESALRRQVAGRRNWMFIGNDDAGEVNATFVSLLASCVLHEIEPLAGKPRLRACSGSLAQDARAARHSAATQRPQK
jgi:hypothetical protein